MTYTPATPQPQTLPSSDQDDFLTNFQLLNQFFAQDHRAFNATSGNGNHTKVTLNKPLPDGPMSPGSGIFPNSSAVYSKFSSEASTRASLYFQNGIGSTFESLMTSLNFVKGSNENGFGVVTPWGITINFGMVNDKTLNKTYDFPVPYTTIIYSIVNCGTLLKKASNAQQYHYTNAVSLTQFISRSSGIIPAFGFPTWYIAVGK